jgi:hypothetical protein
LSEVANSRLSIEVEVAMERKGTRTYLVGVAGRRLSSLSLLKSSRREVLNEVGRSCVWDASDLGEPSCPPISTLTSGPQINA